MTWFRKAARALTPPLLFDLARGWLRAGGSSASRGNSIEPPLSKAEREELVARMDRNDFDFGPELTQRMLAMWRYDNVQTPYPSVLTDAYRSGDAFLMNSRALMEASYRLPYSRAYEETQHEKYRTFVQMAAKAGIDFSGAVVLDVGCGFGSLLETVRAAYPGARLRGVECALSPIAEMARERPFIDGLVADVEGDRAGFIDAIGGVGQVDVVLMTEVLEHLRDPVRALANILALKPRRGIAVTVPNGRVDTAAQHIHFWSPESWRLFIEANAGGWATVVGACTSAGSPSGFDNFAVLLAPRA